MQIISRRVSQGIVFDGHATVTVVEINGDEVTLDVTGPDGEIERVTLPCSSPETRAEEEEEAALVAC